MPHRSSVRWMAPIVLAAAVALVWWVSSSSLSHPSSKGRSVEASPAGSATHEATPSHLTSATTYTVKSGDLLTTVSAKTGVTLDRLRELNPMVDPNTLHVGQKIRLAAPAVR
jgi:LysM repeat protein